MGSVRLALALCSLAVGLVSCSAGRLSSPRAPATAEQAQPESKGFDPAAVNACLDQLRLDSWNARKTARPDAGGPPDISRWTRLVPPSELPAPGCHHGSLEHLRLALRRQIDYCRENLTKPPETAQIGCKVYTRAEWCVEVNERMLEIVESSKHMGTVMARVAADFDWARNVGRAEDSANGRIKKGEVQFTSYYSPAEVLASSVPAPGFSAAIYRRPPDIVKLPPEDPRSCGQDPITGRALKICRQLPDGSLALYHDRRAIVEEKVLEGQGLAIGYIADPVDIVQIQLEGSGSLRVRQPDGTERLVHLVYDLSNGRTNHFLSRILRCMGADSKVYSSTEATREWLHQRPEQLQAILSFDQYFSFFLPEDNGPYGVDRILLSPRHSLATDTTIIPTGSVSLFQMTNSGAGQAECPRISSLGVAQDVGGAIKGAHLDWYAGEGAEAKRLAESMNAPGALFTALPKGRGRVVEGCVPLVE